jgi:hypothetical protein
MKIIKLGGGQRMGVCARAIEEWTRGVSFARERLLILPIPTTRDGKMVNGTECPLDELLTLADPSLMIAGYGIPPSIRERAELLGAGVYDAALDEDFLMENARITAHGALGRILTETDRDMSDLSIGVIGYGRNGSALSELLMFLGSRVRIFSGSEEKIVALAAAGAEVGSIDDSDFSDLDILINTAPSRILSPDKEVELLRSGVRIIELASGHNFSSDEVNVMASIPDKMYPVSSGRMYAKYILRALSNKA